jgi:hypothetical protein
MVTKSRRIRWAGHAARMEEFKNAYKNFPWKTGRKKSLGRHRCRWEDNIRIDRRKIGLDGGDWMHMAQERVPAAGLSSSITGKEFLN